jgi:hypothetical protein
LHGLLLRSRDDEEHGEGSNVRDRQPQRSIGGRIFVGAFCDLFPERSALYQYSNGTMIHKYGVMKRSVNRSK